MKKISKEEHNEILLYLDDLRDSGITNMFGAGKYIGKEFSYDEATSRLK